MNRFVTLFLLLIPCMSKSQNLSFDGSNDYVNMDNTSSLAIDGNVSVSAWVKFANFDNSLAAVISIHSGTNGYAIEKNASANKLSWWIGDGSDDIEVTTNTLSANTWYHIVATNDLGQQVGAGVYLYQLQTKDFVKTRKMVLLK